MPPPTPDIAEGRDRTATRHAPRARTRPRRARAPGARTGALTFDVRRRPAPARLGHVSAPEPAARRSPSAHLAAAMHRRAHPGRTATLTRTHLARPARDPACHRRAKRDAQLCATTRSHGQEASAFTCGGIRLARTPVWTSGPSKLVSAAVDDTRKEATPAGWRATVLPTSPGRYEPGWATGGPWPTCHHRAPRVTIDALARSETYL